MKGKFKVLKLLGRYANLFNSGEVDESGAPMALPSRGRIQGAGVYSIAPKNNLPQPGQFARQSGANDSAFVKRLKQKNQAKGRK
jgi:hypothetical protein